MISDRKIILILALGFLVLGSLVLPFQWGGIHGPAMVFAEDTQKPEGADTGDQEDGDAENGQPQEQPCPECPDCPDPAKVVLRGLEEKKQAIDADQKTLNQQKKELELYEAQIDEKLAELAAVKNQIKEDMARLTEEKTQQEIDAENAYEAKMNRLVKMYAGMKPKNAAQIVDQMELEVAQEIFLRMREASASQILSFVDSAKAAKISERLAYRKK